MASNSELKYTFPAIGRAINWVINQIFFYRLLFVALSLIVLGYITIRVWQTSLEADKYKNIALVFSFGSIVIGIFYTILNYEHNQLKYQREEKAKIISQSFNAASEWHRPTMVENLKITKQLFDKHKNLINDNKAVDFFEILEKDEHARSALVSIFNFLECISLGVVHKIIDDGFMNDYFGHVLIWYAENYGFYISHRRKSNNSPEIWINFTDMADRWRRNGK
jgi:hypothetical protein